MPGLSKRIDLAGLFLLLQSFGIAVELDFQVNLLIRRKKIGGSAPTPMDVSIEQNRGARSGLGEIVGTVLDKSGAVVAGAKVQVRAVKSGKTRKARTTAAKTLKSRVYEYYAPEVSSIAPPVQLEVRGR
jgi:hypothetical protein